MKIQFIQCPHCDSTNVEMLRHEEAIEEAISFVSFQCHEIKCKKFFVTMYFEGNKGLANDSN